MELIQQSFAITLVLVLLWLALVWLRRRGVATIGTRLRYSDKRQVELIERLTLSANHTVYLVRIRDKELALAGNQGGLSVICHLPHGEPIALKETSSE